MRAQYKEAELQLDRDEVFNKLSNYKPTEDLTRYSVSNLGNVRNDKTGRILKGGATTGGYLKVGLTSAGKQRTMRVHKLVAIAFLNHIPNGMKLVVNHKNFNILDNRLENLEVTTQRENSNHKHLKSSSKYTGVSRSKGRNKWRAQIELNGKQKHLGCFNNELEASEAYQRELNRIISNIIVNYKGQELELCRLEVDSVLKSLGRDLQAIIDQRKVMLRSQVN